MASALNRRTSLASLLGSAVVALVVAGAIPGTARAHLALIRQGPESAGSLDADDRTGAALATGDFNGDGYDDLAIGAPDETLSSLAGAGSVVVVYGSRFGLTHVGADLRSAGSVGGANSAGAAFGAALASGDFNGDAYDDLAIGAPLETVGSTSQAGRIYVLHGGAGGLAATADTIFTQSAGNGSIESGDEFGAALTSGDFNGDAYDDLAIGSPGEDSDAGAIFQFPGSAGGITRVGAGFFKQSSLGGTNTTGDRFGYALAAGDLFGDAKEDLAASAPYRPILPATVAGVVYLLQGSAAGLTSAGALSYSAANVDGAQSSGRFGFALATGRFGGGAYRSLAIGEPGRDVSGQATAGRIISVHGSAGGLDWGAGGYRIVSQASAGGTPGPLERFGWSLAVGDRWSVAADDWGTDGYDELAVGTPYENGPGGQVDAGLVHILHSTATNLIGGGAEIYAQEDLGDDSESLDVLGTAVAFGRFDDTGFANLAVSAPDENTSNDLKYQADETDVEEFSNAGCVYVCAPWRQVLGLKSRGTVVYNCQFELVYSQRPFDRVRPASTTKIMTLLLACEHMDESHPNHVDSTAVYRVPDWIQNVGGSTAYLVEDEFISLMSLCKATVSVSANDGAYAIGDTIVPGAYDEDASGFVTLMNQRATLIGMTRTRFSNPAGRDSPEDDLVPASQRDNYTAPVDMALLAREAMFNPIFHGLAGVEFWAVDRDVPDNHAPGRVIVPWGFRNSFVEGLRVRVPEGSGVKPGGTTAARNTRVLSADKDQGRVIVARFGIPSGVSKAVEDSALLALAYAKCDPPFVLIPGGDPLSGPYLNQDNVSTADGHQQGGTAAYQGGESESTVVAVHLRSGSGPAALRLAAGRSSEAVLTPQATAFFGAAPFQGHEGIRLVNSESSTVNLRVMTSHPPRDTMIALQAGGETLFPAYAGMTAPQFFLSVQNLGAAPAEIGVEEAGYAYEITVGTGSPAPGPFSTVLGVGGPVHQRSLFLSSLGRDANPGNAVLIAAYPPGVSLVAVEEPIRDQAAGPLSLARPPWPNPFLERVHLLFDVGRAGSVRLEFYDIQGRRVWSRASQAIAAGRWQAEWEGNGPDGRLAPGLYFFRLWFDGRAVEAGRIVYLGK